MAPVAPPNADDRVGAGFATHETNLFDANTTAFTTREARNVGEILADIDRQARALLFDIEGDHAGGLIRSWPELVNAAAELWTALPQSVSTAEQDRQMERLDAHASSVSLSLQSGWPGQGEQDARVERMTAALREASRAVRRHGTTWAPLHSAHQDLPAVKAIAIHALRSVAHAGVVALQAHGRDRYWEAKFARQQVASSPRHSLYLVGPTAKLFDRFAGAEAITQRYLTGTYATDTVGHPRRDEVDHDRVARALADWDIQAHRTLTHQSSAADHVIVSHTLSFIADAGAYLVTAATHKSAGVAREASPVTERLGPALHQLQQAWNDLAGRWRDLWRPCDRPDPRLECAADELNAAFRELTHDGTTSRPLPTMAQHAELARAVQSVLTFTETGNELANIMLEKSQHDALVGPARALSRRAHNDIEAGLVMPTAPGDVVWVSPADIHAKRHIPLPEPVAQGLARASRHCVNASARASSIATNETPRISTQEIRLSLATRAVRDVALDPQVPTSPPAR